MHPTQGLRAALRTGSQLLTGLLLLLLTSGWEHAQAQQPAFLTNGLVAYYPFNGNANDESGNGNHGTNLGGVSDVDRNGKLGGAYRFVDGQYVNVPHSASLNFGDKKPMTVAFWVKRQAGEAHLLGKRAGQNDCSFQVHSGAFHGSAGNWRAGLAFDVPADPNQWSYITYTFDGDRMAAFINGQLQTSQTGRVLGPLSTAPIKIGSFWGMFLKGSLDEVRFYNRGLSDAEVAALYAYETTPLDNSFITNGLVAYYPFNGNANDESGNGRHGVKRGSNVDQMVPSVDRFGTEGASLRFPGNAYVDVRNLGITQPGKSPRSFFFWARLEHPQQSQVFAFSTGTGGPTGGRSMDWRFAPLPPNGASLGAEMMNWGRDTGVASAPVTNLITGAWEHWGAVYDGTQLLFFRNGLPVATQNGTNLGYDTSGDQALIGEQNDYRNPVTGSASCFKGLMDDMRFYSRALSTAEVKALYDYETTPRDNSFITNGLVAYYPFNGNANDVTAGQNHAQVGSAILTLDRFGRANSAMRCNPAAGKWASLTTTKQISGPQVFTVSAWVRGAVGNLVYFSNALDGNPNIQKDRAIYIEGPSGSILKFYVYPGAEQWLISSKIMSTNVWSFVTVSLSEAGQKLFLNGDLVGANASVVSAEVFNGYWHFGYFSAAGEIDDIRIYNRALSDSEVKTLYAYESTPPDNSFITNGLLAYYPFNGNANDESGNGRNSEKSKDVSLELDRNNKLGAFRFNGSSSFVRIPEFISGSEVTFSAWIWHDLDQNFNYSDAGAAIFSQGAEKSQTWAVFGVGVRQSDGELRGVVSEFGDPFSAKQWKSSFQPPIGKWYHLVTSFNSGDVRHWIDGRPIGYGVVPVKSVEKNGKPAFIGMRGLSGIDPVNYHAFKGRLDDIRIYNRALSDGEVAALNAYESGTGLPQIKKSPRGGLLFLGQNLSLEATASGNNLSFAWFKDGFPLVDSGRISGAGSTKLSISTLSASDSGEYKLVVTNGLGRAESSSALIRVEAPGKVVAWGRNQFGQTSIPSDWTNIVAVAGGDLHTLALRADGTVAAIGNNTYGQCSVPIGLSNVIAIAACSELSGALKADGTIAVWGRNHIGQLNIPQGLNTVRQIRLGSGGGIVLLADGSVRVWGSGDFGRTTIPEGLSGVVEVGAGWGHFVALKSDGSVVAWGNNAWGQLNIPPTAKGVESITVGAASNIAKLGNGSYVGWGDNGVGEINLPQEMSTVVQIEAGGQSHHCIALERAGSLLAWGSNNYGQVSIPTNLGRVISVATGYEHSLALIGSSPATPTVMTPPVNQTVGVGQTLSLSAEISGAGLAYRWQKDGVDLVDGGRVSGAATASLTVARATLADAGQYRLTASNANGNAATAAATVSVLDGSSPPDLIDQGLLAYYLFNGNANDSSGNGRDGKLVSSSAIGIVGVTNRFGNLNSAFQFSGETVDFIDVSNLGLSLRGESDRTVTAWVQLRRPGGMSFVVSLGYPKYASTFNVAFGYNSDPPNPNVAFSVMNYGVGWYGVVLDRKILDGWSHAVCVLRSKKLYFYVNGKLLGVADSIETGPGFQTDGDYAFIGSNNHDHNTGFAGNMDDVRIYNRALSDSEVATLYAYESIPPVAPTFTAQPQSADGMEGDSVTLSVTASGSPAPTLQWFKNGAALAGKTAATLELNPLQASDAGTYHVVAANAAGSVTSSEAVVTVTPPLRYLVDGNPITGTARIVGPVMVGLQFGRPDWLLFYTLDGSTPDFLSNPYGSPFPLDRSADVRVVAYSPDFASSTQLPALAVRRVQSQGITWGSLPVLRYLEKGTVTAFASSGLPVVLSVVSGPGTVSGTELTATGVGPVVLRALQVGSDEFAPVVSEQTVVVAKAAQTLNWPALPNRTFGEAAFGVPVTASSGLGVTLSVSSGKATWSGSTLSLTGAGTVVLSATQIGNSLYESVSESRTFEVAKGAQTLTFAALADRTYSVDPIPLVASASSGLPVAFEVVSGPAQIAGNKVTVTGTGAVTVRAVQSGNADWLAAPAVDRTFVVSKGTQTLTFTPVGSKAYGDAPVDLVATSSSGLPVSFRVVSGPGTIDGKTLSFSTPGNIVVQAYHAGDDLYQPAAASQTVVVTKASQAITFVPIPDTGYTTSALVLSATANSQLPVTFRLVGGPATVTGAQLQLTGLGTVSVAAEQAGDGNWLAAAPVTNRFTVTRGAQTITFDPVPDQILGNPPITLRAVSSAGLPMLYEMVSGPATIVGSVLTLNGEGRVTIRARQLGSPLWLPAQVDQSFGVVNRTTLSVVVEGNVGGTVVIDPVKERYLPTETVTLRAEPATGFRFGNWSGALTGSQNPMTLAMTANRSVVAVFQDIAQPVLTWDLPAEGTTSEQSTRISGVVTDNVGVGSVLWSRDGGTALPMAVDGAGRFAVEGILLSAGPNRFRLVAVDAAGNEIVQERTVVWEPDRVLKVADAAEVQEGQRMVFPLQLEARNADVAGMTFRLEYDPVYLTDPQVEWSAAVGQSVNSLNLSTPGLVSASFALAGTGLPAGLNAVASVSFRARSVPFGLATPLRPKIVNLSSPSGAALNTGNAVVAGSGRIVPRKIKGDNNANQRLDVGDAVVISRLQVGLEEVRSWDTALNDLNTSADIDSGDVVKVLRVVVGLDLQPKAAPRGGELSVESRELREDARS